MSPAPTFYVIYRWKIHPGKEADFEQGWSALTKRIRAVRGGLGSRLHRGEDGGYLAYAQWPDRATWEKSRAVPFPENDSIRAMKAAVLSSEPPLPLDLTCDLLAPPAH